MNIHVKNCLALLPGEEGFAVEKKDIFISEGRITALGSAPEGFTAQKVIDASDRLVIPGLINCHTHNYMSLFRNSADDVPFDEWLFQRVMPREDKMVPEDAYWGATLGIMEMLRSGTTCFNDMQMHIHQTTQAAADAGIRAVIGRGLSGTATDEGGARRLREAEEEIERWKEHPRLTFTIAPHAPYTCDKGYLKQALEVAKAKNLPLHIHLSESAFEVESMKKETGLTPISYAASLGLLDVPVIIAHCVHVDEEDIRLLSRPNVSVVTNPASNMKLGNGFAPIPEMLASGVRVCLGTDGAASNNSLNLFREMGLVTLIHKGNKKSATSVSAVDALQMATIKGAQALGLEQEIGSIAVGKKADLAILNLREPQMMPQQDLIAALSYSANGSEVETVLVDGEIVMENRHFRTIDEERVYYEVTRRAE
ncbi:amidohydrolase [Hominifimenecus sp. rT4P-3]|uniref:amidohydrolase n=1 Tax=Hominifimenecus sp. rT4P-3 TaxID=3242979 RepID=UPI003DA48B95